MNTIEILGHPPGTPLPQPRVAPPVASATAQPTFSRSPRSAIAASAGVPSFVRAAPPPSIVPVDRGVIARLRSALLGSGVERLRGHLPPPPRLALQRYVGSPDPRAFRAYERALGAYMDANPLDHLAVGKPLGSGASKDCFAIKGTDAGVLLVNKNPVGWTVSEVGELMLLASAGFPVVEVYDVGKYAGRDAVVQEKLADFCKVGNDGDLRNLLKSPRVNGATLHSLRTIRNLIAAHRIVITDLQGGLAADGTYKIADPRAILPSEEWLPNKFQLNELDAMIRSVAQELRARGKR